jgi:hypothetical protein
MDKKLTQLQYDMILEECKIMSIVKRRPPSAACSSQFKIMSILARQALSSLLCCLLVTIHAILKNITYNNSG